MKKAAHAEGGTVEDRLTQSGRHHWRKYDDCAAPRSLTVPQGIVASYVHNAVAPSLGKIGVLVALESSADAAKLQELGKQIAMHVAAAASSKALTIKDVDTKALDRERNVLADQARASGKPEEIIGKMVEGRSA